MNYLLNPNQAQIDQLHLAIVNMLKTSTSAQMSSQYARLLCWLEDSVAALDAEHAKAQLKAQIVNESPQEP